MLTTRGSRRFLSQGGSVKPGNCHLRLCAPCMQFQTAFFAPLEMTWDCVLRLGRRREEAHGEVAGGAQAGGRVEDRRDAVHHHGGGGNVAVGAAGDGHADVGLPAELMVSLDSFAPTYICSSM